MKKSTLALSVAAALGGLGFVGSASAITTIGGATATALTENSAGIGHQLLYPYFSAQSDNATLINVINTDTVNGKLVKVRFRGAGNSDDLYDYQLLLSPGDVYTAAISKDAATGLAKLASSDVSCVIPASASNSVFSTLRTDPSATDKPNQTREGYIEMINMADIRPGTSLFTAIKHVNSVAPCTASVLDTLKTDITGGLAEASTRGLTPPSGGLTGDWVLLNQLNTAAWSGPATALMATGGTGLGNLVFWPQIFGNPSQKGSFATMSAVTSDPLLTNAVVDAQFYDLPDVSTPYVIGDTDATVRADLTSTNLRITSLKHQIVTSSDIGAVTDIVLSQPTRRYNVAVNYVAGSSADNTLSTSGTAASAIYRTSGTAAYNAANTSVYSRQVCLDTVNIPSVQSLFNREELSPLTGSADFVISPNVPTARTVMLICGEASVLSINQAGTTTPSAALSATVARSDATFAAAYTLGWASWDFTTAHSNGLPVLGATFMRARNGMVNYGFSFPHKATFVQ